MMLISLVSQVLFNAYAFLCCVFIDTTIFLCVDRCCKVLLSRCVTLSEKRDIWLFESLTLFGLSSILFIYHHYPILLWILGVITFTSATLTGRVDSQFYWDALKTYWREFSDQQEHLNAAGEDAAHSVAPTGLYKNQVSEEQCREYMRQGDVQINNDNAVNTSSIGEGLKALHYNEKKATYELIKPVRYASRSSTSARYRGAANSLVTQVDVSETDTAKTPSLLDNLEGFGSKVWSYLGLAAIYTKNDLPPGLSSSGSNLCFLNSVLQCIARAPNLADELAEEVKSCRSQDVRRLAFLDAVTEVLQQINVINRESGISLVDTQALCQAGALLNSDLLVQPEKYQPQQDACELLTWLLHEIHEAINEAKGQKLEGSQDESMRKLKTVYGNISESYTKMMKEECKAQIAGANGFTDAELPELVQNLANLEWITYRRTNRSVVDGLFTFQCIELQMCSSCNLTSVNVQSMAMLSFPVAKHATSIHLSSCLTDFVAHERLYGRDGLQCSRCQSNALAIPQTPSQRQQSPCIQSELLSPIQGDKTLPNRDAQFLSSTPLLGNNKTRKSAPALLPSVTPGKVITEGIRQCFVRRLPECLTIQLMRFNFESSTKQVRKVTTPVTIPLHHVDFADLTYDSTVEREDITILPGSTHYSLYALILHIGGHNTNSGHYLSYCRGLSGCWYKFDDDQVFLIKDINRELARTQVMENCYLLFYRKDHNTS